MRKWKLKMLPITSAEHPIICTVGNYHDAEEATQRYINTLDDPEDPEKEKLERIAKEHNCYIIWLS